MVADVCADVCAGVCADTMKKREMEGVTFFS